MNVTFMVLLAMMLQISICPSSFAGDKPIGANVAELIDYAIRNSPALAVAQHELEAARNRVGPAGALPNPTLSLGLMYGAHQEMGGSAMAAPSMDGAGMNSMGSISMGESGMKMNGSDHSMGGDVQGGSGAGQSMGRASQSMSGAGHNMGGTGQSMGGTSHNMGGAGQGMGEAAPASKISGSVQLSQTIPLWGKRDLRRRIAETEADQRKARHAAVLSELTARIKVAYVQYFLLNRGRKLNREALDLLTSAEALAREHYAAGLTSLQEVTRIAAQSTSVRSELIMQDTAVRQVQGRLNALLGRPASASLAEPRQLRVVPASAEVVYVWLAERLRATNPELLGQDARIKIVQLRRELAAKEQYPDLMLSTSLVEMMIGMVMSIPLQFESHHAHQRAAAKDASAERARKEAFENQLLADLMEHLAAVDAARKMDKLGRMSALPQANLALNISIADYRNGKGNFNALLDAQIQMRKAGLERLKAQGDQQIHLAEIERLLGDKL